MLPGIAGIIAGVGSGSPVSLMSVLTGLGLTTNLKLCLDAGDILSITSGSPTKWLDRSGNGYDFNFGSGSGSDSADPTFVGTPGGDSSGEYLSSNGTDYLTYDSANEAWMETLHKNSAIWSACGWTYEGGGSDMGLFGTMASTTTDRGVQVFHNGSTDFTVRVYAGGSQAFTSSVVISSVVGRWVFWSFALDEASNVIRFNVDGTASSSTCTYSSPSASNATHTLQIGAMGNGARIFTGRLNSVAMWQGTALSAANLDGIFQATRGKFGV